MVKMVSDADNRIVEKLNILVKLNAANVIQGKDFKEQVRLLSSVGLQPKEIGDILGKTANNVRVTLSYIRKESSKGKDKKQNEGVEDDGQ